MYQITHNRRFDKRNLGISNREKCKYLKDVRSPESGAIGKKI